MRTVLLVIASFVCGVASMAWLASSATAQSQPPETATTELLRADLGDWCPGKEALVTVATNGPRTGGRHFHPGHSFSWVIEGSETVFPDGRAPYDVTVGDLIHEAPFEISETKNTAPTKVVTFRILEKGQPPSTYVE